MRGILISLAFIYASTSCKSKASNTITITGNTLNSTIKEVYFTDAYDWQVLLDSADVNNNTFKFTIPKNKLKGLVCSIGFFDGQGKRKNFDFKNHILCTDTSKFYMGSFLIDTSVITMTREPGDNEYYTVRSGKENDAYYSTQMMNFGYLDKDAAKRTAELHIYIGLIQKYPYSQFLLSKILDNKSLINKSELELMLKNFNTEALKIRYGKLLHDYVLSKADNPLFENLVLEDNNSIPAKIFDSTAKINMLIVWASWCGPCRKEIPDIKQLYNLYCKKGLTITNISVDENKDAWQSALKVENMNWRQLLVTKEKLQNFNSKFEVGSIPYVLFLDNKGKLITRFIGYEKSRIDEYKKIIEKQLQ